MTIYIIRHGETDFNKQGKVQGRMDTELNHKGWKQGDLFHQYYKNIEFDVIITSALKRTHQTLYPFIKAQPKAWVQLSELNEINWGVHEGKSFDLLLEANYAKMMAAWDAEDYEARIEEGESATELGARAQMVVEYLKTLHAKNVLVCTHGRTLLCLITLLKGEPLKNMKLYKHQNTCLYVVHYVDGEFVFEIENDVRHLIMDS